MQVMAAVVSQPCSQCSGSLCVCGKPLEQKAGKSSLCQGCSRRRLCERCGKWAPFNRSWEVKEEEAVGEGAVDMGAVWGVEDFYELIAG